MFGLRLLAWAGLLLLALSSAANAHSFVPFRADAPYYYEQAGAKVFFRDRGVSFVFQKRIPQNGGGASYSRLYRQAGDADALQTFRIDLNAVGANGQNLPMPAELSTETVRFITQDKQNTPNALNTCRKLTYQNIFPNVDWVFYTNPSGQLKYDFILKAGAKSTDIRLQVKGSERIDLTKEGILNVHSPIGSWSEEIPCAYLTDAENTNKYISALPVKFAVNGDEISFRVPDYDNKNQTLVIDPLVRMWATFFGGYNMEHVSDLTTDPQGNVYATGFTASPDLPVTAGVLSTKLSGNNDVFVACFSPSGERKWATFFGGKQDDQGASIAWSPSGKIAVTGQTNSDRLPHSEKKNTGGTDAFLLELNADGSLNYVTMFGGKIMDEGVGIAYDTEGGIIIAGTTESSDFPVLVPAFQSRFNAGGSDAFLIRFDENKKRSWATFLGGGLPDVASDLAIYENTVFLTGTTQSRNFPVTGTATITSRTIDPAGDVFVASFNHKGEREWVTCIGGRNRDEGLSITVDNGGTPTVCGLTISQDFPTTKNAFQDRPKGLAEGFITQFTSAGEPLWSTLIGGSMIDHCFGIASAKANKSLFITGKTNSKNFPTTSDALMFLSVGTFDGFITQFSNGGKQLWSTYYGGVNDDEAYALATDPNNAAYVGGRTASRNFPVTSGAFQGALNNNWDAFLIKFEEKDPSKIQDETPAFASNEIPPDENIFTFKFTVKNVSCKGGTDGAIDMTVTGGTPPYTFKWSNGVSTTTIATTEDLKNIPAGKYTVTVTDDIGLSHAYLIETSHNNYKEGVIEVKEPANGIQVTLTGVPPSCPNSKDGRVMSVISGGQSPFTTRWSNGSTESALKGVDAGTYSVTVTDANGCQTTATTKLDVPSALSAVSSATNASCGGSNDGKIVLTITGGTPPYTFAWSNGQTVKDLLNLAGGNYSVTITDKNNCSTSVTSIVSQGAALSATVEAAQSKCDGANDASVKVTLNGGTPPFIYKWSNNTTLKELVNVPPGTYSVTITDKNNCSASGSAVVQQAVPMKLTLSATNPLCFDAQNGAADATIVGGKEPYTFLWSNGQNTQKIIRLAEGTYSLTVTDANGCKKTATATLKRPAQLTAEVKTEGGSCLEPNKPAKVSLNISGGTAPYSIAWSDGSNAKELNNVPAGEYSATITDTYGCSTVVKASIKKFTPMQVTVMVKEPGCEGGNTAGVDISPSGGQPPITFAWSNGVKTEDLTGVPAGTYTVTLTDANKCTFNQTVEIKKKEPIKLTEKVTQISCHNGNNGEIEITVIGGQPPYTYQWSTSSNNAKITGLTASTYGVEVTDANGCKQRKEINLAQPEPLLVKTKKTDASCEKGTDGKIEGNITGGTPPYKYEWSNGANTPNLAGLAEGIYTLKVSDARGCTGLANSQINRPKPFTIEVSKKDVGCTGANDGTASVTTKEGTPPFTYLWSNGQTTAEIKALKEGPYTVAVTDANGCKQSGSVTLSRPPAVVLQVKISNITCNQLTDGKVETMVSGGTPPFTYKWSNNVTESALSNLPEGSYAVTVTDAKNCTQVANATVKKPALLTVNLTPKNVSCNGEKDASIAAKIAGGTEPYKFTWSNGANTQNLQNVEAGTYKLTVTDGNNCTADASATIIKPSSVSVSIDKKDLSCLGQNDGSAKAVVSGGKEPFTFLWSNGLTKQELTGLKEGDLSVIVTDANGCKADAKVTLSRPPALTLKLKKKDVSCSTGNDGSAEATLTGGKEPFTYKWSNDKTTANIDNLSDGNYTLTVTDVNGCIQTASVSVKRPSALTVNLNPKNVSCNGDKDASINAKVSGGTEPYKFAWSNGAGTQNLLNVEAGKYQITVTDANNCTTTGEATVIKPAGVNVSIEAKNLSCSGQNDGTAKAVVSGGKEPFTFSWSNGATKQELTGLKEGEYGVTVTDANGCKSKETTTLSRPPAITLKLKKKDISCAGYTDGALEATLTGGKEPFTYKWSNDKATQNIDNLSDGTFTLTVTDVNGCTQTASASVKRPAPLTATVVGKNVSCSGDKDGSVIARATGGIEPYQYSWNNSANSINSSLTGIEAGTYKLRVTDANGCTATAETTIIKPAGVTVSIQKKDLTCGGTNDGSVKAVVTGGKEPFTFAWSNGLTKQELTGLKDGEISVNVTDANGCKATAKITLNRPPALAFKISKKEITCANVSDGKAEVKISSGQEPFTYAWSNGKTTGNVEELGEGTFTVTVTDANGCKNSLSVSLKKPAPVSVTVTVKNVSCGGTNDGGAQAKVTGGNEPYKYLWSNGGSANQITGAEAGTYKLTVTDANGCVGEATANIVKPNALSVTINKTNLSCTGTNDGTAKAVVTGGKAPFTYAWSNLLTTAELKNLKEGEISLTVTDANGCKATAKETLTKPASLTVKATAKNLSCADATDGKVEITITGGKEPYTYAWSNQKTTQNIESLGEGTFTVTVSDANGCKGTASGIIKKPETLKVALYETNLTCSGKNDGKINAKTSGGTPPYQISWSKGGSGESLTELDAGEYAVTATDANGCKATAKVELKRPPSLSVRLESSDVKCYGGKDGSVKVNITGGTEPFTYTWSSGEKTKNLNAIAAGEYTVTVSDAKGCTQKESVTLTQPNRQSIFIDGSEKLCEGQSRKLSVAEGFKAYKWSNGETTPNITVTKAGTYSVEMTTESGCKTSAKPVQITVATPPTTPKITIQGDTLWCTKADRYQWYLNNVVIGSSIAQYHIATEKGEYKVRITDDNGCTAISAPQNITPKATPKPKENAITVYPNPTTGFTNIKVVNLNSEALDVKITDPSGKVVFSKTISALDKVYEDGITIKDDGGPTGKYILTVKSKTKTIKETITVN